MKFTVDESKPKAFTPIAFTFVAENKEDLMFLDDVFGSYEYTRINGDRYKDPQKYKKVLDAAYRHINDAFLKA